MSQTFERVLDANQVRVKDYFFDTKTRVIYFIKSMENQKIKFSTGEKLPDIEKAKRMANRELRRILNKKKLRSRTLIKDELELWLASKEAEGHKYDTLNNIRRAKKQIEEFWGSRFPHEISRDNLTEWYGWWAVNHPDIQMENAVKYLRVFCAYLAEKTVGEYPLLPAVPTIKDPNFKEQRANRQKKKERIISPDEFKAIFDTAAITPDKIAVLFMYTMATRISETLSLRFGHEILLDKAPPTYRWSMGQNKADLWGHHHIHESVVPLIQWLRAERKEQGTSLLFPQKGDNQKPMREQMIDWDEWRLRAGLDFHWTPHTLRHTCLSNLFNDPGNPQALICKLYRVSIQTAMEYYITPTDAGRQTLANSIKVIL